ncbi:unnamed protein product [Candida verbasci]|uniref:Peptidase M20 dimerisation domain-containing protein n=1 Tax=Candida verbasci TaxID=1227364 RepID=A0A9W4TVW1_9ASCO|nr:unnamed protein product [Candida verbasci]
MTIEKSLPLHSKEQPSKRKNGLLASTFICFFVLGLFIHSPKSTSNSSIVQNTSSYFKTFFEEPENPDGLCPIIKKINPHDYLDDLKTIDYILKDKSFFNKCKDNLLGAIQIPTEVYDDMINPNLKHSKEELYDVEPRWKSFEAFHKYLQKTYPLVQKHLKLETVNKFGLVYSWEGSDKDKKPIILAAHQDVVPVARETLDQWTYPPFKGGFDGKYLYGRGASDCKNLLIGLLNTVELLLKEEKFNPERTIILAFGYDEESAGSGAFEINKHLVSKYGPDSILQIIDEGNEGFVDIEGSKFILPATGEKGYLDSIIEFYTPGGHSSVPPKHTSIGIIAKLIEKIESKEFSPILSNINPVLNQLYCIAEHSPNLDPKVRKNILKSQVNSNANKKIVEYLSKNKETKYLIQTSQAIDIIQGGIKSNALPEHVSILVNSRIAVEETIEDVIEKYKSHILEITDEFDLGLIISGQEVIKPTKNGYFNYSLVEPLEPAPVSPINGESWNLFGGSLRYLYEDLIFPDKNDSFIIAPFMSTGNTDTKSYWELTRNIYRYVPGLPDKHSGIHSVDEKLIFKGHLHMIAFYYYYLQLIDGVDDKRFEDL